MWKRHHTLILIIAGIGVLYLLYEWFKGRGGASSSSGSIDTSNLPTVISTGGGAYMPSSPSFGVQTFGQATQPIAPVSTPDSITVMPGTSASGVPAHTAQAQEFNINAPIATPGNPGTSSPSYYASAQSLAPPTYNNLDAPSYVPQTGGGTTLDLASYLAPTLRSFEIGANTAIGNKAALDSGMISLTPDSFQTALKGNSDNYCAQHPEACQGDNASVIANLVSEYKSFIGSTVNADQPNAQNVAASTPAPAPSTPTRAAAPVTNLTPDRTSTNRPAIR